MEDYFKHMYVGLGFLYRNWSKSFLVPLSLELFSSFLEVLLRDVKASVSTKSLKV